MRLFSGIVCLFVVCVSLSVAQTSPEDTIIAGAQQRLEKLQSLVDAGAAPRAQLAQAEDDLADAQDAAILRKTLYGPELTDALSEEMIAAAGRRYERRKRAFDKTRQLVLAGVATQASLFERQQDLDLARSESDLAYQRAKVVHDLAAMAEEEAALELRLANSPSTAHEVGERYDGNGVFNPQTFARVETAFESHFGKPLPVSAMGETAVHRALGFNHAGRVDVALHPDEPEGVWLRAFLGENHIPYFAFRQAVPGKATGAHIHIGPQSTRAAHGG
jgi:hypothetical protein